jgi:hypothetical protein
MSSPPQNPDANACIPNINREQRRRRLAFGLVVLAFSVALFFVLWLLDVSRWWRLALLPLFYAAMSGVFQWRDET